MHFWTSCKYFAEQSCPSSCSYFQGKDKLENMDYYRKTERNWIFLIKSLNRFLDDLISILFGTSKKLPIAHSSSSKFHNAANNSRKRKFIWLLWISSFKFCPIYGQIDRLSFTYIEYLLIETKIRFPAHVTHTPI